MISAHARHGVTVIELIVSLGIITILFGVSTPLLRTFLLRSDLDVAQNSIVQDTYRSQSLAMSGEGDSSWGVKVLSGQVTVFQGTSYAARNSAFDESYALSSSITISGQNEYVFSKLTGFPTPIGTTTLTNAANETRTLTINSKGMIEEQ